MRAAPTTVLLLAIAPVDAFVTPVAQQLQQNGFLTRQQRPSKISAVAVKVETGQETKDTTRSEKYWEIAPSMFHPAPRPLTPKLRESLETNTHPEESQEELGYGVSLTCDWRENWCTYEGLDDPESGYANYELDEIEGTLPPDLVGVLYRNGPGKFELEGQRVQHTLDADALVYKISFPEPSVGQPDRKVVFTSRFVHTKEFKEEKESGRYLYRGTFGTGPTSEYFDNPSDDQEQPKKASLLSKILGSAFNLNIKNTANTHIISFGGKLLTLFEASLPYRLDPDTLETLGEDTLDGMLQTGLPVQLAEGVPAPDFIGGTAHTAHPQVCPKTGNLVGWHWAAQAMQGNNLQITFTEYAKDTFAPLQSNSFLVPGCELAPHDMAMTDDSILLNVNALTMNQLPFLLGAKGPAESLAMDGRAPVQTWVFPRPTADDPFEPFCTQTPACFTIHHSHGYKCSTTGNLVTFFSGWPPSDSKDFLGAWGGHSPEFNRIPATFLWRLEVDPKTKKTVSLEVAPGSANACIEHVLVHPNFITKPARYVYGTVSNLVGDSTPPNGYARVRVETGSQEVLPDGEYNEEVEAHWFGTRYFTTEPIIVPKDGGNADNEKEAYLLGMIRDGVEKRNFLAIFDLEQDLSNGPVCKVWLKNGVPHGIHGCFARDDQGASSVFC